MPRKSTFNKLFIFALVLILIASIYIAFMPNEMVFADDPVSICFKIQDFWREGLINIRHQAPNVVPKKIVFEKVESISSVVLTNSDIVTKDDEDDPLALLVVKYLDSEYDDTIYIYFEGDVLEVGDNESAAGLFCDLVNTSSPYDYLEYIEEIEGLQYLDLSKTGSLYGAFFEKKYLKSLDLSQSLIGANAQDVSYMFYNCTSLQSLKLPSELYFIEATSHVGMFYGLDSLYELDLSSFAPTFTFEMDTDFDTTDPALSGPNGNIYTNFIKADNLYKIKLPTNITAIDVPQSLREYSIGEFAVPIIDNNQNLVIGSIKDTINGMWGISDWQYKVGYIDYYMTIDDVEYKIGSDKYLQSYEYKAKTFTLSEISEAVGKDVDIIITTWQAKESAFNFAGAPGNKMGYSSQDDYLKDNKSPIGFNSSNPLKLYANIKDIDETPPFIPNDNSSQEGSEESVIENNEKEDKGLTTGQKAGIAAGVVGGAAAAAGTAAYFFTGVAEIDGVKKFVIVTKKTVDEAKVITFKGKKYKIKRKNLKIRRKEEEDENGKKKRKKIKIPIFFLKR